MHAFRRAAILAVALYVSSGAANAVAAEDPTSVYVRVPYGITAGVTTVSPGPAGEKYVSVEDLTIPNPSHQSPQTADPHDFHLVAGDATYGYAVRKGLDAIDFSTNTLVDPGRALNVTVTFLVPDAVTKADFAFTPHWFADDGRTVDFCCDYP